MTKDFLAEELKTKNEEIDKLLERIYDKDIEIDILRDKLKSMYEALKIITGSALEIIDEADKEVKDFERWRVYSGKEPKQTRASQEV